MMVQTSPSSHSYLSWTQQAAATRLPPPPEPQLPRIPPEMLTSNTQDPPPLLPLDPHPHNHHHHALRRTHSGKRSPGREWAHLPERSSEPRMRPLLNIRDRDGPSSRSRPAYSPAQPERYNSLPTNGHQWDRRDSNESNPHPAEEPPMLNRHFISSPGLPPRRPNDVYDEQMLRKLDTQGLSSTGVTPPRDSRPSSSADPHQPPSTWPRNQVSSPRSRDDWSIPNRSRASVPRLPPILGFSSTPTEETVCHSAHGDESPFPFPRFPSPAARTNRSSIDSTMDEEGAALGRLDIRATPPLSSSYPTTRRKRRAHSPPSSIYGPFSGASEPSRKEPMLDAHMDMLGRRTPPIHHGYPHSAGLRTSPSWRANTFSSSSSQQSSVLRSISTGPLSVTSTPSSSLESRWPQMLQAGSESSSSSSSATIRGYSPIAHGASDVHGFIRDPPQPQLRRSGPPHMCTCCPKKPKRFETQEDLNAHEAEKQYKCLYCNNRFKNKNEAERHQNSLHLRRYSWSCAVLADNFQAAFHPLLPPSSSSTSSSSSAPNSPPPPQIDICGYCGEEFPLASVNGDKKEWQERKYLHLQDQHKFGECNQQKKFYRADHFRQHLKHSHGGTSGKWTNELEKSCMQPEEGVGGM